jgi:hypothetical protein
VKILYRGRLGARLHYGPIVFVGLCVVQDGLLVRGCYFVGGGVLPNGPCQLPECIVPFNAIYYGSMLCSNYGFNLCFRL